MASSVPPAPPLLEVVGCGALLCVEWCGVVVWVGAGSRSWHGGMEGVVIGPYWMTYSKVGPLDSPWHGVASGDHAPPRTIGAPPWGLGVGVKRDGRDGG
nr:hypothetical protein Iba_chr15aCG11640 [Ipomoea batatas]